MEYRKRKTKPLLYQYYLQKEDRDNNDKSGGRVDTSDLLCASCGLNSGFYDASTGETICSNCGIILSERAEVVDKDPKTANRVGMPTSLVFPDKGLRTIITDANKDASGTSLNQDQVSNVNKIRHYDKISVSKRTEIRNLRNAFVIMAIIKDRLALTDPITERSAYYYRKALEKKMIKGRSIREVVVAAVYASCKEMSVPRTLQEIALSADADYVFAGKCYRIMANKLEINPSIVDASGYISKIANNANVNQKTYKKAVEMLDEVKKDSISYGKDPRAIATAVLYHASTIEEKDVTLARIAKAGGISIVTLRKRISDVVRVLQ